MSSVNDEKIMSLRSQIKEKKANLKGKKNFNPITNCSLEIDGTRYNLRVLTREILISLLVKLNAYRLSAIDLGLINDYNISGYKIGEWITDMRAKLENIVQRDEELKLQELENKLGTLLSTDKKVELEINSIESMLK